jgi:hypothetical protein
LISRENWVALLRGRSYPYGYGEVADFLAMPKWRVGFYPVARIASGGFAEDFIKRSLKLARHGVAMLTRTVILESVGRHERLFLKTPPARVGQFSERVPMIKGRLDRRASTATGLRLARLGEG